MNDILPPFEADEWYLDRGTAVHLCAKYIAEGVLDDYDYDPRIEGQVQALKKFFKECDPQIIVPPETAVASKIHRFAGTIDIGTLAFDSNRNLLIDYKSTLDEKRVALQLGGYAVAAKETLGKEFNFGLGIAIKADGKYSFSNVLDLRPAKREFLALRGSYAIRDRLGYHKKKKNGKGD